MDSNEYIFGIHSVIEAIEAGKTIDKLYIKKDLHGDLAIRLVKLASPLQSQPHVVTLWQESGNRPAWEDKNEKIIFDGKK